MGVHYPLMYSGYEVRCLNTFINLIDGFCSGCHTNDDFENGCKDCPIGKLIYQMRGYIIDCHVPEHNKRETKIIKEIKEEIEEIEPHPLFNSTFIFQGERTEDSLEKLRKLLKDLKYQKEKHTRQFRENMELEGIFTDKAIKEIEKKRKDDLDYFKKEEDGEELED